VNSLRWNSNVKVKIYCPIIEGLELNWFLSESIAESHWVCVNEVVPFANIIGTDLIIHQKFYLKVWPAMRVLLMTLSCKSEDVTCLKTWLDLNLHGFFYLINWSVVPLDLITCVRDWFDWTIVEFEQRAGEWDFNILGGKCSWLIFSSLCVSE